MALNVQPQLEFAMHNLKFLCRLSEAPELYPAPVESVVIYE